MTHWTDDRFRIERFNELGMAIRRSTSPNPKGTLFYIHGLGESGLCFERIIADPRLGSWNHVVPDLIGYGKSAWSEHALDLEQHAVKLGLLIERLGLESLTLVGHSMGGVIGLKLSVLFPNQIEAFINIEGNISPADCTGSAIIARRSLQKWLDGAFEAYLEQLHAANDPRDINQERHSVLRAYAASARFCDPRTLHLNSCDLVRESGTETLARQLADLGLPQIYIHGIPRGTGSRSQALLTEAGIPMAGLEPAGHWPYLDQYDAFIDTAVDFLTR